MAVLLIGMGLWLAAIGSLSWSYVYLIPYGYPAMDFLILIGNRSFPGLPMGLQALSLAVAGVFACAGLLFYVRKPDLG